MLILSISHHVYLTKEQRYALIEEGKVDTVGVSVPVWIKNNGMSTEPAVEVFCNYELTNVIQKSPIHFRANGYVINMPQKPETEKDTPRLSDEIWRSFTQDERQEYYASLPNTPCANWLRDIGDGGGMHLQFREHNKIFQNEDSLEVYHYIHIDDMSRLMENLS